MGRHVISVVVTGDASDFNRAMRNVDTDVRRLRKGLADAGSSTDRLNQKLNVSSAQINRFARSIKKAYPDIEGLGRAMDSLRAREAIRIRTIFRIDQASRSVSKLSGRLGLATAALAGINLGAAAIAVSLVAVSQTLIGVVGGGLLAAFGALYYSVEENREALAKVASTIRDDLINNSMKPFMDLMGQLPDVLMKSYEGARKQIEKLGDSLKPLLKSFFDFMPEATEKLFDAFATAAKVSKPYFDALLDGVLDVIVGLKQFFKAFEEGDTEVLELFFKDVKRLLKLLGESLASLTAEDYKKLRDIIVDTTKAIADAFKTLVDWAKQADEFLGRFGGSLGSVAAGLLGVWAASKLLLIPVAALGGLWKLINSRLINFRVRLNAADGSVKSMNKKLSRMGIVGTTLAAAFLPFKAVAGIFKSVFHVLKNGLASAAPLIQAFSSWWGTIIKFGKIFIRFAGPIGLVVTALMAVYEVIKQITTEGTFLNDLFNTFVAPAWGMLVDAFNDVKTAVVDAFNQIKGAWDDLYIVLEGSGVIAAFETVVEYLGKFVGLVINIIGAGWLAQLTGVVLVLTAGLKALGFVIGVVADVISFFVEAVGKIISAIQNWWNSSNYLAEGIRTSFGLIQTAFNFVKDVATKVIGIVIGLFKKLQAFTKPVFNAIKNVVVAAFNFIKNKVIPVTRTIFSKVKEYFNKIKSAIQTVINFLKPFVSAAWQTIKSKIINPARATKDAVVSAFNTLKSKVISAVNTLKAKVKAVFDSIVSIAKGVVSTMVGIGADIVGGIARGIRGAIDLVLSAVRTVINAIPLAVRKLMGISSPAKKMMPLGRNISEGVAVGIGQGSSEMTKALDRAFNDIINNEPELKALWDAEIKAAKDAAKTVEDVWSRSSATVANTNKSVSVSGTVNGGGGGDKTYNITVNSNSPNVGREIVREIQKYESANGSRWRQ